MVGEMTLPELVLFILGALMVAGVFGWIVACLVFGEVQKGRGQE